MITIRKKIIKDRRGHPTEVVMSWAQYRVIHEALGLDLDAKARGDLRTARRDWKQGNASAFKPLSAL